MRIRAQKGFALVAVVSVVMIAVLVALAQNILQATQSNLNRQTAIASTLTNLDNALVNFVAVNRRLPCPAAGTAGTTGVNAGFEQPTPVAASGACTPVNQANGVIPWATLGLPSSAALDPWGHLISYRVDPSLTARFASSPPPGPYNAMDMSNCTSSLTVGSGAVAAQVSGSAATYNQCSTVASCSKATPASCTALNTAPGIFANKGLNVWNGPAPASQVAFRAQASAAAYVLISHGKNGAGAYNTSGILVVGTGTVGTSETPNFNNTALTPATSRFNAYTYDDIGPAATYFDDQIDYRTISWVLQKANLGPRN